MPSWLTKIEAVLTENPRPVKIFFRDDDAGWANDRLMALLDVFAKQRMPIDLAVIPAKLDQSLADKLLSRWRQTPDLLGLHQHGYSHVNHEPEGERKCEFGPGRNRAQQTADLKSGRKHMNALLGDANDPIFTPPWNRCSQDAVDCLTELGIKILSRDRSAKALESGSLKLAPVDINWSRIIRTSRNPAADIAAQLIDIIPKTDVTGIMFHHADMADPDLTLVSEFLAMLSSHPNARSHLIKQAN